MIFLPPTSPPTTHLLPRTAHLTTLAPPALPLAFPQRNKSHPLLNYYSSVPPRSKSFKISHALPQNPRKQVQVPVSWSQMPLFEQST